jgi:hypothetical protein
MFHLGHDIRCSLANFPQENIGSMVVAAVATHLRLQTLAAG